MCKKLMYLIPFALVLSLVRTSTGQDVDPSLVGWWKFEEASGTLFDQSDNHNDSTSFNGVLYQQAGQVGYALGFDGTDDYVLVGTAGRPTDTFSFGGWFKTSATHEIDPETTSGVGGVSGQRYAFDPPHGGDADGGAGLSVGTNGILVYEHGSNYMPATAVYAAEIGDDWNHIMIVYDNKQPTIYLNGQAVRTGLTSPRAVVNTPIQFGGMAYGFFEGSMDEVRIYNRALSAAEIRKLAARPKAWNPSPADGALYALNWASLTWKAGGFAVSHNVYMGDNFADVNDGTGDTFLDNVLENNMNDPYLIVGFFGYPFPDGLVAGTTYYWRVDEVNDMDPNSPWKGNIWSFSIPPRKARDPVPADGTRFVDTDVTLAWTPGFGAATHTVYFGDDFDTVNNATGGVELPFTTYTPGPLERDKTYYWRIDETDDVQAVHTGDVWSFTTIPIISITDPNLLGWWKLDEGYGAIALDWSGHENHGTIYNANGGLGADGSAWDTDAELGTVLSFNGDNGAGTYVNAGRIPAMTLENAFTWAFWTRQHENQGMEVPGQGNDVVLGNRSGGTQSPLQFIKFTPTNFEYYNETFDSIDYEDISAGIWLHHAVVKEGTSFTYYRNGVVSETKTMARTIDENPFFFGGDSTGERWQGWLSDVRIYDRALTQEEVKQTMRGDPALAWDPKPANGSTPNLKDATPLGWSPGDYASQHDVYFGTDKDAVENADTSTADIYRGRQGAASYTPPEVEWGGGPYYWRIDEYNTDETTSKGRVWSFTVADFIGVDNIETYDVDNAIWANWLDGLGYVDGDGVTHPGNGSGSEVGDAGTGSYTEEGIVHGGSQSMPYWYNNNKPDKWKYSEAKLTLSNTRNWTEENVKALSLWFYGDPANAAEQMYLAVANNTGAPAVVQYAGDADDLTKATWQEWNIDLTEFSGVNLTDVNSIAIGFGDRNSPQIGGSGKMYFDDIRLYRARCVPSVLKPDADLSGNCVVDMADIEIMGADWLAIDSSIAATAPSSPPVAWWKFDNNTDDSAGTHNGIANGFPSYAAGMDGQAISLDGVDDYVSVAGVGISGAAPRTIAGWAKANATEMNDWTNVFGFTGPAGNGGHFDIEHVGDTDSSTHGYYGVHMYGDEYDIMPVDLDWHHLAATYDGTATSYYGDGILIGSATYAIDTPGTVHMGKREDVDSYFPGLVDDVRIYNYVLSDAEIAGLVDETPGDGQLYVPVPSVANIYDDEPQGSRSVDFKDFAILADSWLDELLWPAP